MNDTDRLTQEFEQQANFCAWRCQYHKHSHTCLKYSYQSPENSEGRNRPGNAKCRFKYPHACWDRTEITEEGLVHRKRANGRINRWNRSLAVGLRHNFDLTFLNTSSQGLSMAYYITNYATKLNTPTWKRVVLAALVASTIQQEEQGRGPAMPTGTAGLSDSDRTRNNATRQFFNRWANKIFSDREVSSVEACYHLLGHSTDFSNESNWTYINMNTLYWTVLRNWPQAREAARESSEAAELPESVTFTNEGPKLSHYAAYPHRGAALAELSFWEYLSYVSLQRSAKWIPQDATEIQFRHGSEFQDNWVQILRKPTEVATPIISGYLGTDVEAEVENYYQRLVSPSQDPYNVYNQY